MQLYTLHICTILYAILYTHLFGDNDKKKHFYEFRVCVCTLHAIGIVHVKMYRYVQRIQLNCIHSCCCCCNFYFNVHFILLSFSFCDMVNGRDSYTLMCVCVVLSCVIFWKLYSSLPHERKVVTYQRIRKRIFTISYTNSNTLIHALYMK